MIRSPNDTVEAAVADGVCTITLSRPQSLNAIDGDMATALHAVTEAAAADAAIRCVLVRGAGDHFMAGGDIAAFRAWLAEIPEGEDRRTRFEAFVHRVHPTIRAIRSMPKPAIAAVHGAVAGFGMSLMSACDLAVASESAFFTLAYCHIGVSPDGSSTYTLPRTVGLKRSFEMAYLGERFGAEEAKEMGLVNRVVPEAGFDTAVDGLARCLAAGPTRAYANAKALLNASARRSLDDQLDAEAAAFADCAAGGDFAEGIAAFLDKRTPSFAGR
ncbi:MAG: enoyl-CoA hydratase-related protein [Defluviicoccus sp.]|nr:enoyl-CoA hydratase-related protein [Defluviicoccus sp.]MDE0386223.1 enoyl-CoA hydratase-related protein [Defluviicoccus sp.]